MDPQTPAPVIRKSAAAAPRGFIPELILELTERCNNACAHCYVRLPEKDSAAARELTTEAWEDVLGQAAEAGVITVRFTGGEPLLRPDFTRLYLHARRLGMKVRLCTNACLIDPEIADCLARTPPLEKIQITVYGMHPETYERMTGSRGSYAAFRRGVDLLLERRVPFMVSGAMLPLHPGEVEEFEAWTRTLPWTEEGSHRQVATLELRVRRDNEAADRRIRAMRLAPEQIVRFLARDPEFRARCAEYCAHCLPARSDRLFGCDPTDSHYVDAYGRVHVCYGIRDPDLAFDLRTGTLREALFERFPRIMARTPADPEYLARCARCFLRGLCDQCPGKSWSEHGTLDRPVEYICAVGHEQARFLGLLADGERAWEVCDGPERLKRLEGGNHD